MLSIGAVCCSVLQCVAVLGLYRAILLSCCIIIIFFPYWWLSYNKLFYLSFIGQNIHSIIAEYLRIYWASVGLLLVYFIDWACIGLLHLQKRPYSTKETCNLQEPTGRVLGDCIWLF